MGFEPGIDAMISLRLSSESLILAESLQRLINDKLFQLARTRPIRSRSEVLRMAIDDGLRKLEHEFIVQRVQERGAASALCMWRENRGDEPVDIQRQVNGATVEGGLEQWMAWERGDVLPSEEMRVTIETLTGIPRDAWAE